MRTPDLQIEAWLHELEISILAHNLDVGDLEHDTYVAAKCEYELNPSPNMDYVRGLLAEALSKPFATKH